MTNISELPSVEAEGGAFKIIRIFLLIGGDMHIQRLASFMLVELFSPDDGGENVHRNFRRILPNCTALHPTRSPLFFNINSIKFSILFIYMLTQSPKQIIK
jgi:hypothetical protein